MNLTLRTALAGAFLTVLLMAEVTPDTVVATINGKKMTAAALEAIIAGTPANMQEQLRKDRRQFVERYALVTYLADAAEKEGLAEKSPFRENLHWNRMQVLWQAALAEKSKTIESEGGSQLSQEQKQARMQEWLEEIRNKAEATYESQEFFESVEAAAQVSPETVVAMVNGRKMTAADIRNLIKGASANVQENFRKNPRQFLQEFAMMDSLVSVAESAKYAEWSPYREQMAWVRSNVMMQARLDDYSNGIVIRPEDEQAYYDANKDKYTEATVKVIYVPFGTAEAAKASVDGKKVLTEDEALALVKSVRQQLSDGADFAEMVQKYSEDATSKAKDGDFGKIRQSDKIPDHIKNAVFSLRQGEVSEPVRQPNGYYLFRAEEIKTETLDEVRQKLIPAAKSERFNKWFQSLRNEISVSIENEEYFAGEPRK